MSIDVKCEDFLKDNRHMYAVKAKRKKIALISVQATNRQSSDAQLMLASSQLISGGKTYNAESAPVVIRKLTEFTWDFLLYPIIDFHPVTATIELVFFLIGPLYNRRLKRQLALLSDSELSLRPGECKTALVGFRRVSKQPDRLTIPFRGIDAQEQRVEYFFDSNS